MIFPNRKTELVIAFRQLLVPPERPRRRIGFQLKK